MYSHNSICFSHIFTGCFTCLDCTHNNLSVFCTVYHRVFHRYFTGFCDPNSSSVIHIYFHRVIHSIPYFLLQSKVVSQAVSHAFLNSTLSGNFSHNFSHGKISCLKAVFTSQDISQGVSHAKKFTWFSHGFHILFTGLLQVVYICSSAHAQNGGHTKRFLIVNFLKSSRTTYMYAQFLKLLHIHQHRSPDNVFSKSVRQILKYFSKFPFLTFSLICKKTLLQIFVLTCKKVYFYPKLKW